MGCAINAASAVFNYQNVIRMKSGKRNDRLNYISREVLN